MRASLPPALLLALVHCCTRPTCPQCAAADGPNGWRPIAAARLRSSYPPAWQVLGTSVERRPIQYARWGDGERMLLILGPLAGDRTEGLEVIERLAAYLAGETSLPHTSIVVVRDPNPDGRARGRPFNAHGVDLDRNFPTTGWRKQPRGNQWISGPVPQSEPETRALVRFLQETQPECVVFISTGTRASVGYLGRGERPARKAAAAGDLPLWSFDDMGHPGSCPSYAGTELGLPVVLLMCAPHASAEENWRKLHKPLLALLALDADRRAGAQCQASMHESAQGRGPADVAAPAHVTPADDMLCTIAAEGPKSMPPSAPLLGAMLPSAATSHVSIPARPASQTGQAVGVLPSEVQDKRPEAPPRETIRYLLPFTAAARRARLARMAELFRLTTAQQTPATDAPAAGAEDGLLVPVVRPSASSGQRAANGERALAEWAIERLPAVSPHAAADQPLPVRNGPRHRRTLASGYPRTNWPD